LSNKPFIFYVKITSQVNKNNFSGTVDLLDFSREFDLIPHGMMREKKKYGMNKEHFKWIKILSLKQLKMQ